MQANIIIRGTTRALKKERSTVTSCVNNTYGILSHIDASSTRCSRPPFPCPGLLDAQLVYVDFVQLTTEGGPVPTPAPAASTSGPAPVAAPVRSTPGGVPHSPIACFPSQADTTDTTDDDGGDDGGYYSAQVAETNEDADTDAEVRSKRNICPRAGTGYPIGVDSVGHKVDRLA